jgi:outer membrane phospholipase A
MSISGGGHSLRQGDRCGPVCDSAGTSRSWGRVVILRVERGKWEMGNEKWKTGMESQVEMAVRSRKRVGQDEHIIYRRNTSV